MSQESSGSSTIEVLVVDDHPVVCDALSVAIDDQMGMDLVGTCHTAGEAMSLLRDLEPDVAVVDISLRDAYGLDLVENIRSFFEETQVIVFSMYSESVYAERAIKAGAMGYIMKSQPVEEVVDAIRSADSERVYLSDNMASHILNRLPRESEQTTGFPVDSLTDRELAVFQMLGRGHSIQDITDRLSLSRKTVETYRRRAKEKLDLDSISELLQFAVEWTHGQAKPEEEVVPE